MYGSERRLIALVTFSALWETLYPRVGRGSTQEFFGSFYWKSSRLAAFPVRWGQREMPKFLVCIWYNILQAAMPIPSGCRMYPHKKTLEFFSPCGYKNPVFVKYERHLYNVRASGSDRRGSANSQQRGKTEIPAEAYEKMYRLRILFASARNKKNRRVPNCRYILRERRSGWNKNLRCLAARKARRFGVL